MLRFKICDLDWRGGAGLSTLLRSYEVMTFLYKGGQLKGRQTNTSKLMSRNDFIIGEKSPLKREIFYQMRLTLSPRQLVIALVDLDSGKWGWIYNLGWLVGYVNVVNSFTSAACDCLGRVLNKLACHFEWLWLFIFLSLAVKQIVGFIYFVSSYSGLCLLLLNAFW